jgi:hypothetical protein
MGLFPNMSGSICVLRPTKLSRDRHLFFIFHLGVLFLNNLNITAVCILVMQMLGVMLEYFE